MLTPAFFVRGHSAPLKSYLYALTVCPTIVEQFYVSNFAFLPSPGEASVFGVADRLLAFPPAAAQFFSEQIQRLQKYIRTRFVLSCGGISTQRRFRFVVG
jgi:hypothetical protein